MFSKKNKRYEVLMPLTSLIDIVFLLLVYFLLTTNFMVDESINIKLPKAKASMPQVEEEIIVYIDKAGAIYLSSKKVKEAMLFDYLKEKCKENKTVIVKADKASTVQRTVRVMDIAKAAGAKKLGLATEK